MGADDFEDIQPEGVASDEFSGADDDEQSFGDAGYWGADDDDDDEYDGQLPDDDDDEGDEYGGQLPDDEEEVEEDGVDLSDSLASDGTESVADGDEDEDGFNPDVATIDMVTPEDEATKDASSVLNSSDSIEAAIHEMSGGFEIHSGMVYLGDIVLLEYVKNSRKETYMGLTQSISEWGQLHPITVAETAAYARFKEVNPEGVFTGRKYILIDGLRRVYSMTAMKYDRAQANILSFEHPEKVASVVPLLRSLYNKVEHMSWSELWGYLKVLDESYTLAPNIEEYLLGLDGGDIMKFKDIMANQDKYPEIVDNLFSKKKTLDQSYSALNKARKEEDKLRMEDQSGIGSIEEAKDIMEDDQGSHQGLSEDEVKDVLEMSSSDMSDDDFAGEDAGADLAQSDFGAQDVHDRHILPPEVKQACLRRDNFTCVVCGVGGAPFIGTLVQHHPVPVYAGGRDIIASPVFIEDESGNLKLNPENNLVTLCDTDHLALHSIVFRLGGKVPMTKAEYDSYSPEMKERLRKLKLLIDIQNKCDEKLGKNRKVVKLAAKESLTHRKPWEGVEEAAAAYNGMDRARDNRPIIGTEEDSEVLMGE
jgi:5-methylcytosine-specific restriction protein A